MRKKLLTVLLCVATGCSLAACSSSKPLPEDVSSKTEVKGDSITESESVANAGKTDEDYPLIRFNLKTLMGYIPEDMEEVVEAMNIIFREKAHAVVEPVVLQTPDQLTLMLTGGNDALDFYTSFLYQPVSTLAANGQAIPLDELLDTYGKETKALFDGYEQVLDCGRVGDKLYGIPTAVAWASPNIYFCRKADVDAANVDLSKVTDLKSLTNALLEIKKANPQAYYIPGAMRSYWMPNDIDYLGDTNFLGVIIDPANGTKVENYYESDYFMSFLDNVKIWAENDIILPDPMSNQDGTAVAYTKGLVRGSTGYSWSLEEFLYGESITHSTGEEDTVGATISPAYLTTSNVSTYLWHISPFGKNPEAAMRVLNLFYTDPELSTLLCYGIKDKNWVVNKDGQAAYPEGKGMQTAGWIGGANLIMPNCSLNLPWDNQSPDVYKKYKEANKKAIKSVALGFNPNLESVSDQVAACVNVVNQYYLPIINAAVDIDKTLPEFQKALHDAGIDDIISEKQRQFDEWKAGKAGK